MFAAIYFGQVAFAALPFVSATPPPPPPPPVPHHYDCRFAIGQVIGTASHCAPPVRVGGANASAALPVLGTAGGNYFPKSVGTKTGPSTGTCP